MSEVESEIVDTLPLRKSIKVHGKDGVQEVNELKLRLPSGRLVLRLGEPFTTKIEQNEAGDGRRIEFKVNPTLATEYLAEMSGINSMLLGQLHALDVLAAFDKIVAILRPMPG